MFVLVVHVFICATIIIVIVSCSYVLGWYRAPVYPPPPPSLFFLGGGGGVKHVQQCRSSYWTLRVFSSLKKID